MRALITGATGQVGGALVERLLARGDEVLALCRRPVELVGAVRVIHGDIERPLDVPGGVGPIDVVFHCAALTRFDASLEEARRVNVGGTRHVVALAERLGARIAHVSTAYVAGARTPYERSKLEAEAVVRAARVPWTIFRPSVIIGEAATGRTRAFNVLYAPMRLAWRDRLPVLPCGPAAAIDVVPVDFVAEAMAALASRGGIVSLASGDAIPIARLADVLCDALDRARARRGLSPIRRPRLVAQPGAARLLAEYLPYLLETRQPFAPERGLVAPALESYLDRIVEFAIAADFGALRRVA